ncbi:Protein RRC1 [Geodia barretti]|uniref:Protein RRC1 n=2 Tax=Geodia barretti TaxID=519541 RepID=A0AA35XMA2_GEOBA|nr:Protein RRC1 [Geodia barretti]
MSRLAGVSVCPSPHTPSILRRTWRRRSRAKSPTLPPVFHLMPRLARGAREVVPKYGNVPPPGGASQEEDDDFERVLLTSLVKVVIPTDMDLLKLIHRMIEFVIREGPMFEAMIMNREMSNPLYQFLFDNQSPAHIYYRWKLFSILNGDSPETWRTDEFRMFDGGSLWKPPPLKNLLSKVLPPIQEVVKKGALSAKNRDYLEDKLRSVTMERESVRGLMMWCMEHSDSADEIVECVSESLCINETPLPTKLARLYLLNDILHNCTSFVYNSSAFRRGFEGKLVTVMEHFHTILRNISSRIRAEQFKRRVLTCMRAWDTMSVYHFNLVDKLRETFIGKTQEEAEKQRAFQTVAMLMQPEASTHTTHDDPEPNLDGVPLLESQPIDFSRAGGGLPVPVDMETEGQGGADLDGEPLEEEDLDGVPMADADIDGIPLEKDNIDGEPLEGDAPGNKGVMSSSSGVRSKWELVDYGDDSSEEEEEKGGKRGGEDEAAQREKERQQLLAEIDEKKRKILREVEVKVMELSDALESSGSYSRAEISERLQKYRDRLMQESVEPSRSPRQQKTSRRSRSPSPSTLAKYSLESSPKKQLSRSHSPEVTKPHPPNSSPSPPPPPPRSPTGRRSKSRSPVRRKKSRSRSPRKRSRSPRQRSRSRSPRKRSRSRSPRKRSRSPRQRSRSRSPTKRSHSPKRHRSQSPHSHRHRSPSSSSSLRHHHHRSSKKSKRRSRSRSPHKKTKKSRH